MLLQPVTDDEGHLDGVASLRSLVFNEPDKKVDEIIRMVEEK